MANKMIEQVARAMCVSDGDDPERYWQDYEVNAKAALQSLRKPTQEMIIAGCVAESITKEGPTIYGPVLSGWHAMIDAALDEDKS